MRRSIGDFESRVPGFQECPPLPPRGFGLVGADHHESHSLSGTKLPEAVEVGANHVGDLGVAADRLPVHAQQDRQSIIRYLDRSWGHSLGRQLPWLSLEGNARESDAHPIAGRHDFERLGEKWVSREPIELRSRKDSQGRKPEGRDITIARDKWKSSGFDARRRAGQEVARPYGFERRAAGEHDWSVESSRDSQVSPRARQGSTNREAIARLQGESRSDRLRGSIHFQPERRAEHDYRGRMNCFECWPRERDLDPERIGRVRNESIRERECSGIGRTAHGHSQMPRSRLPGANQK